MIAQRLHRYVLLVLLTASCLVGCASVPERADPGSVAAGVAYQQVGVPYRYGGHSPSGFDCSGLVHYSYSQAGINVPRTTSALWQRSTPVDQNDLRVGDILFFNVAGKMSHVGLYLGKRRFVHAPSSGKTVTIGTLDSPYYSTAFIRAGRL
ncbi:MAG: C40 family peptidase [Woeseiaceae bacterium]|nr:C40 family peptidase [Woeseiaceae bacterium]